MKQYIKLWLESTYPKSKFLGYTEERDPSGALTYVVRYTTPAKQQHTLKLLASILIPFKRSQLANVFVRQWTSNRRYSVKYITFEGPNMVFHCTLEESPPVVPIKCRAADYIEWLESQV